MYCAVTMEELDEFHPPTCYVIDRERVDDFTVLGKKSFCSNITNITKNIGSDLCEFSKCHTNFVGAKEFQTYVLVI